MNHISRNITLGLTALLITGAGAAFTAEETSRKSDLGYETEMAFSRVTSDILQDAGNTLDKIKLDKPAMWCFRNAHEYFANYAWNIDIKYDKFRWR